MALDKQRVLSAPYVSRLKAWRAAVTAEDKKTWKNLISRLLGAAVAIPALVLIGAVTRRVTRRYMRDPDRRHIALVIQRVVLWSLRSPRRVCFCVGFHLVGYFLWASAQALRLRFKVCFCPPSATSCWWEGAE